MTNYDFLNLDPFEFQNLIADLFQERFKIHVESFNAVNDKGIDARFLLKTTLENQRCIVQCKRFSNFTSLYGDLKLEIKKLKHLQCDRFFLVTSVDLTVPQIDKIVQLFKPFELKTEDVWGKTVINRNLSRYKEIVKSYYKLYLSSIDVLSRIMFMGHDNYAEIEKAEINKLTKVFVQYEGFPKALKILSKNKVLIIVGNPGIGKTTLARFIILNFFNKGVRELIFANYNLDNCFNYIKSKKKQIYWYDDFLGSISLDKNRLTESKKLFDLWDIIKSKKNKFFILTTRIHILNDAKKENEIFEDHKLDISRLTLTLDHFKELDKAKILYSHLYHSSLEKDGINKNSLKTLIDNNNYSNIINHKNYNPRLIRDIINMFPKEDVKVKFYDFLKKNLDNPGMLWEKVYNKLKIESQIILCILGCFRKNIKYNDLLNMYVDFGIKNSSKYKCSFNEITFKDSLRTLQNSFVSIVVSNNSEEEILNFESPSIEEFVFNNLSNYKNIVSDIVNSTCFVEPYVTFLVMLQDEKITKQSEHKHYFNNLITLLCHEFNKLKIVYYGSIRNDSLTKLNYLFSKISLNKIDNEYHKKIIRIAVLKLLFDTKDSSAISYEDIDLILRKSLPFLKIETEELFELIENKVDNISDLYSFSYLVIHDRSFCRNFYLDYNLRHSIKTDIRRSSDPEDRLSELEDIVDIFDWDLSTEIEELKQKIEEKNIDREETENSNANDFFQSLLNEKASSSSKKTSDVKPKINNDMLIKEMFTSLI